MNRTRRIWTYQGNVFLRDSDDMGEESIREFWVPSRGGYIREISESQPGTLGTQVCEMLGMRGYTLSASPDTLESVIRREYRRRESRARREARA